MILKVLYPTRLRVRKAVEKKGTGYFFCLVLVIPYVIPAKAGIYYYQNVSGFPRIKSGAGLSSPE
jgi:hypothetical protein